MRAAAGYGENVLQALLLSFGFVLMAGAVAVLLMAKLALRRRLAGSGG